MRITLDTGLGLPCADRAPVQYNIPFVPSRHQADRRPGGRISEPLAKLPLLLSVYLYV